MENKSDNKQKNQEYNSETPEQKSRKKKMTSRQAVALAGVILLAALYIGALIAAVADSSASGVWFRLCLFGTIFIPIIIWIYAWLYGRLTGKHTIADPPSQP